MYSNWISPSDAYAGTSGSLSVFLGVSSVSTRNADGSGEKGSGDATTDTLVEPFLEDFKTWYYFPQLSKVKGFLEYQHSGYRNSMVITELHKYRVNGSGQSLSVRTIKKTLARKQSQYHNTHTHSL